MSDDAVLAAMLEILKLQGNLSLSDLLRVPGIAGSIQARRVLNRAVRGGLLKNLPSGGFGIAYPPKVALHEGEGCW